MPGGYRKFSKGLWTLKTKGHCCLKSCTSAWKISALLLKTMSFLLEGRRDCLHPITPSQQYALGILPNPKVPDDVLQSLDECKNKMLFKMHSLTFSLTSLTLQVCRLSLIFFKVWNERTLHLKRPCSDASISTICLHRQQEQQHLIQFWLLVQPL